METNQPIKIDNGAKVALSHGVLRSPHWHYVEETFLHDNPNCIACQEKDYGKVGVQIHHAIVPFHLAILCGRPDLELDPRNLVSLCETEHNKPASNHHLLLGHLKDFASWNKDVREDAKKYFGLTEAEILAHPDYMEKVKSRPDPIQEKSPENLAKLKEWLDQTLPPDPNIISKFFPKGI